MRLRFHTVSLFSEIPSYCEDHFERIKSNPIVCYSNHLSISNRDFFCSTRCKLKQITCKYLICCSYFIERLSKSARVVFCHSETTRVIGCGFCFASSCTGFSLSGAQIIEARSFPDVAAAGAGLAVDQVGVEF